MHRTGTNEYDFSPDRPDPRRCMDGHEMVAAGLSRVVPGDSSRYDTRIASGVGLWWDLAGAARVRGAVRGAGHEPRRPKPDEPQFDLAWEAGDVTWVAEVKSVTPQNEVRQLRLGLGQVLRYRQLLEAEGRAVRAMIATEVEPRDRSWIELCEREELALAWAPDNLTVE